MRQPGRAVGQRFPAMTWAAVALSVVGVVLLSTTLLTWAPDNNPRWLLTAMIGVAVATLVWTLARGSRLTPPELAAMVAGAYGGISVLTWGTDRLISAFANGTSAPMLAVLSVWFLPYGLARVVSYGGTALWCLAAWSQQESTLLVPVVGLFVQVVIATEVLGRLRGRLDRLAHTDALTEALNRRGIEDELSRHLVRRARLGTPVTVLVLDIDGLRAANSAGGHAAGDDLLRRVAAHWRTGLRDHDVLGRVGGDEFVVVLPGVDHGVGDVVARRLATDAPTSWSVGVAEARAEDDAAAVIARADRRMYEQKAGRHPDPD